MGIADTVMGRYNIHMKQTLSTFTSTLRLHQPDLSRQYFVRRFGIFGSYAVGEEHANSDVDLLVEFSKPISFFRFVALEKTLTELLGREVDLVTPNGLKGAIKKDVLKHTVYV